MNDTRKTIPVKVGGNIISELSEKIPSNIIALNELIKNSYDAGSPSVYIELDDKNNKLIISDDGEGMDSSSINTLFHLAKSTKKYGEFKNGRYVQGSKGLGFLSAFKFGKGKVTWYTNKSEGLQFSADYKEMVKQDNITDYKIELLPSTEIKKGTKIVIELDDFNKKSLLQYFGEEKNYRKVIHAFTDDAFIIKLKFDDQEYTSNSIEPIKDMYTERQLYSVKYSSDTKIIDYYFNNHKVASMPYDFTDKRYKLDISLGIYQFRTGNKKYINKLFYNKIDEITPLIFVNNNLFENYDLFDPGIMQKIKKGDVLNQMIGYINIYSDNEKITFNSDRTQFAQNDLTDEIRNFLQNINKYIQREGAARKAYLVDRDFLRSDYSINGNSYNLADSNTAKSFIKCDFYFKDKVIITQTTDKITYEIFGIKKEIKIFYPKPEPIVAKISLTKKEDTIYVPSSQIDLKTYIDINNTNNSAGKKIEYNEIEISVDGVVSASAILASVENPCIKRVTYTYDDATTGKVINKLILNYVVPTADLVGTNGQENLLTIQATQNYTLSFNPTIIKLVNQLNSLLPIKNYTEVAACSVRSLFEISIKAIRQMSPAKITFTSPSETEICIKEVINFCLKATNLSEIDKRTNIGYKVLEGLLDEKIVKAFKTTGNLGAHISTMYMSENDLKDCAQKAAIFLIIANEVVTNPNVV